MSENAIETKSKIDWIKEYRAGRNCGLKEALMAYYEHTGLERVRVTFEAYNTSQVLSLIAQLKSMAGVDVTRRFIL